jgi:endonuclease/exonuclease/phosphatase family metal-dependent hydrolase
VRIATFNLENLDDAADREPSLGERLHVLRPQLTRLAADVLCLQEVNAHRPSSSKSGPRRLTALETLLAGTPYESFERVHSHRPGREEPMDVQNLVILSRYPIVSSRQYWHDLVAPPSHRPIADTDGARDLREVRWERPVLHAEIEAPLGAPLHVFNLHYRAPLAAYIPGQKEGPFTWKTVSGWAEGYYLSAVQRTGQALETRLAVERIFDIDPDASILICGDMNAVENEMPLRILRADEEDTGNGALAPRVLFPLEATLPGERRFSVRHAGRQMMLDHILASRFLTARLKSVEIHNETLGDEVVGYALAHASPETYHAPVVAEFVVPSA